MTFVNSPPSKVKIVFSSNPDTLKTDPIIYGKHWYWITCSSDEVVNGSSLEQCGPILCNNNLEYLAIHLILKSRGSSVIEWRVPPKIDVLTHILDFNFVSVHIGRFEGKKRMIGFADAVYVFQSYVIDVKELILFVPEIKLRN